MKKFNIYLLIRNGGTQYGYLPADNKPMMPYQLVDSFESSIESAPHVFAKWHDQIMIDIKRQNIIDLKRQILNINERLVD